jgi:hypothetical protein
MGQTGCEMDDDATRAKTYRQRAAEMRIVAENVASDNSRRLLLKIAADYDRMSVDLGAGERSIRKA